MIYVITYKGVYAWALDVQDIIYLAEAKISLIIFSPTMKRNFLIRYII